MNPSKVLAKGLKGNHASVENVKTIVLPGQTLAWHDFVSLLTPTQSFPPNAGRGWVHERSRSWDPVPHVCEHGVQSSQSVHPPSTGRKNEKKMIIFNILKRSSAWRNLQILKTGRNEY